MNEQKEKKKTLLSCPEVGTDGEREREREKKDVLQVSHASLHCIPKPGASLTA